MFYHRYLYFGGRCETRLGIYDRRHTVGAVSDFVTVVSDEFPFVGECYAGFRKDGITVYVEYD